MSGKARRKAVSHYIRYASHATKDSSFNKAKRFAKCMMGVKRRYSRLAESLTRENCLLKRLQKKYPQGLPPYHFGGKIVSVPLVWEENER